MKVVDDCCYVCGAQDDEGAPYEYMETIKPEFSREHVKCYRCVDRKACARRVRVGLAEAADEYGEEVRNLRESIELVRADIAEYERRVQDTVREALNEGVNVTRFARAAGLSRERIYQIRDGRR